ncbi:hypothetical protein R6242_16335 [Iodobacter sp. CM08]|uniref:hypothetical protein n=1 Tax=Iodobacter sp. CM08 TaxID=3085902 RepID=UPI00298209AD|nr:hypothetical protein [Iodobacter sp. CM08]MDW5418135.1 hypothetical protein [Iodobacter sp. CM08]
MNTNHKLVSELKSALSGTLEYIDAIPSEFGNKLPSMREFNREHINVLLQGVSSVSDLQSALRASLEYIDSIPSAVADFFPLMPGIDRDWADNLLDGCTSDDA